MFVSPAYAQAGGGAGGGLEALLPLVLIFVVFYFLLIRPQQKKMKEHKAMLGDIKKNDQIVTGGGIMGKVTKVNDDNIVTVEIAKDVNVKIRRELISTVLNKTPTAANDAGARKSGGLLGGLFGGGAKQQEAPVEEEAPKKATRKPRAKKKPAADNAKDGDASSDSAEPANDDK